MSALPPVALPAEVPVVAWDSARGVYIIHADSIDAAPRLAMGRRYEHRFHKPFAADALAASRTVSQLHEGRRRGSVDLEPKASPRGLERWMRRHFGAWA